MIKNLVKKLGIVSLIGLMGISTLAACSSSSSSSTTSSSGKSESSMTGSSSTTAKDSGSDTVKKIGIIQIVEHPALDSAREGFVKALKDNGYEDGKNIKIDYQNAQGDKNNLSLIANNFKSDNKDLILAVATPSAQTVANVIKDKPIFITAVTDPVEAGLVKSLDKPETNVSGTTDISPIEKQFGLLKKLLPNAKKVGVLYNTSEANSIVLVDLIKKAAPGLGLEIVDQGVTNTNEVAQAVDSIIDKVDCFYVPTDNTIVSSIALVTKKASEKNKAVIGSERGQIEGGALATEALDYEKLGYQTGEMAVKALKGEDISTMPVETQKETQLLINKDVADKLKVTVPQDLLDKAEIVKSK